MILKDTHEQNPIGFALQVVTALGKVWHPEHFVCTECETELGSRNFFEKDGRPYCESDYFTLFSPHCAQCNKPILNVSSRRVTRRFGHTPGRLRQSQTLHSSRL